MITPIPYCPCACTFHIVKPIKSVYDVVGCLGSGLIKSTIAMVVSGRVQHIDGVYTYDFM